MKLKKSFCLLVSVVFAVACFAGCSAQAPSEYVGKVENSYDGVYDYAAGEPAVKEEAPQSAAVSNQKLVRNMRFEVETDDLDGVMLQLQQKVDSLGGYIEEQSVRNGSANSGSYRYADLKVRVPATSLEAFVDHIQGASNVTYYEQSTEDITLQYVATDSRVKALEMERDRLMELMDKAENMSDLLKIEQRLTDVLSDLEQVTSQLRVYDNMVDYGTVHLYIYQVQEFTPTQEQTPWQRMGEGFVKSLGQLGDGVVELFVKIVIASPYLVLFGGITVGALLIVKHRKKKVKTQKTEEPKE